jgi:hypothetical protein
MPDFSNSIANDQENGSSLAAACSSLPRIGERLPSLANQCYLVGQGKRADLVWSRGDFYALCEHMLNGNSLDHFLAAWVDSATGQPRFAKAGHRRADKRAGWVWDSITEKAKLNTSMGFYPSNRRGMTRWGAIDFDAHQGEHERARNWSLAAFQLLLKHPQLYLVLCSSGGGGFHLFIYTLDYHRVREWIILLKEVCAWIGASIADGVCEIFPNERAEMQIVGKGIRAPGTWNPKTGTWSLIEAENVQPLLELIPRTWSVGVGKVNRGFPRANGELSLHRSTNYYSLSTAPLVDGLLKRFPIDRCGVRNGVLVKLVGELFFKFGRSVSEQVVKEHYARYKQYVRTPLDEHLREFAAAWDGLAKKISGSMSAGEQNLYRNLSTSARREGFMLTRGFAGAALHKGRETFQIARGSLADRLNITPTGASDVIRELVAVGAIEQVEDYKPHRKPRTYRWILLSPLKPQSAIVLVNGTATNR